MLSDVDRVDNFLKTYMPAGGEVSLSWGRIKTALAELGTTPNTGSPKLPTLVECERWYVKEKCGFEHITELEKNVIREIHDYICRQLRASA